MFYLMDWVDPRPARKPTLETELAAVEQTAKLMRPSTPEGRARFREACARRRKKVQGDGDRGPAPGWLERQRESVDRDVATWPPWMRRELERRREREADGAEVSAD